MGKRGILKTDSPTRKKKRYYRADLVNNEPFFFETLGRETSEKEFVTIVKRKHSEESQIISRLNSDGYSSRKTESQIQDSSLSLSLKHSTQINAKQQDQTKAVQMAEE